MRKLITLFLVLLFVLSPVFAFSFSFVGNSCLYDEGIVDHYNFNGALRYLTFKEGNPNEFLVAVNTGEPDSNNEYLTDGEYILVPYETKNKGHNYVQLKPAIKASVFRFEFGKNNEFKLEGNLYGYVNLIFEAFSGTDVVAYDGAYFLGGTLGYKDYFALRIGVRHFSTHLGDEKVVDMYSYDNVTMSSGKTKFLINGTSYNLIDVVEYVRQNPLSIAFSAKLPVTSYFSIRAYGEMDIPFNGNNTRPFSHTPSSFECPYYENVTSLEWQRDKEGVSKSQYATEMAIKDSSYRALKIHTGLETAFDFGSVVAVLGGDVQFHQDGKTLHRINGYNKNNPWEIEYSLGLAIQFKRAGDTGGVNIEAKYHDGRFPTPALFYQRSKYISLGVSIY
ncbi:MAG: hypothetical protein HUK24_05690 [Sphaerochaetaceae bacterium]|nr:hypothetical protein [Sphaerochaetaceae bacterium]